jgi:hypothetical protein
LTSESNERSFRRDPVRAGTRRVVVGSTGHLERLQTSKKEEQHVEVGKVRVNRKGKDEKK